MSFELWVTFCTTEVVLCLIPGPAVCYVLSATLAQGFRPGVAGSLGILAANIFYFTLSATGIVAVIAASGEVFLALKWAGAAYLMWVGLQMLISPAQSEIEAAEISSRAVKRSFWRGVVVQGANPKAIIFFIALLPQFINPKAPVGFQVFVLCASGLVIEFVTLLLYISLVMRARRAAGAKFAGPLMRLGGVCLVGVATKLAIAQQK